jgi:hypothetical protein
MKESVRYKNGIELEVRGPMRKDDVPAFLKAHLPWPEYRILSVTDANGIRSYHAVVQPMIYEGEADEEAEQA